jgi:hypothetical protein
MSTESRLEKMGLLHLKEKVVEESKNMKSTAPSKEQLLEKLKHLSPQDQLKALQIAMEHVQSRNRGNIETHPFPVLNLSQVFQTALHLVVDIDQQKI